MNDKFLSLLGMARKAGKLNFGYEKSLGDIHSKKTAVIFTAEDLSDKTAKGLFYAAEDSNIAVLKTGYTMFEFTNAIGLKTGIISVTDRGFAKKLQSLLNGNKKYLPPEIKE